MENKNYRLTDRYIHVFPGLYEQLVTTPFTTPVSRSLWLTHGKRCVDLIVSLVVLIMACPLFIGLAVLTRLSSPGPVIYRQKRIGRGGKPFVIYKFRSMYVDAEADGPRLSGGAADNRITAWGWFMRRTRLDEIPQFYNVLKGDMALVGPRPERQFYIDQLARRVPAYLTLLQVRPGLTSVGQVYYGYAANLEEMVERAYYDLPYLKNQSLRTDLHLLLQTLRVILNGHGK